MFIPRIRALVYPRNIVLLRSSLLCNTTTNNYCERSCDNIFWEISTCNRVILEYLNGLLLWRVIYDETWLATCGATQVSRKTVSRQLRSHTLRQPHATASDFNLLWSTVYTNHQPWPLPLGKNWDSYLVQGSYIYILIYSLAHIELQLQL